VAVKTVVASRRWLRTVCRSKLGLSVEKSDCGEPRASSRQHHHLFILRSVTEGHQTCRVGRPRSGRVIKAQQAVGPVGEEIKTNILPFDLTLHFNL
jgi:hypothetical protein